VSTMRRARTRSGESRLRRHWRPPWRGCLDESPEKDFEGLSAIGCRPRSFLPRSGVSLSRERSDPDASGVGAESNIY
jgi:hypothetical protein